MTPTTSEATTPTAPQAAPPAAPAPVTRDSVLDAASAQDRAAGARAVPRADSLIFSAMATRLRPNTSSSIVTTSGASPRSGAGAVARARFEEPA